MLLQRFIMLLQRGGGALLTSWHRKRLGTFIFFSTLVELITTSHASMRTRKGQVPLWMVLLFMVVLSAAALALFVATIVYTVRAINHVLTLIFEHAYSAFTGPYGLLYAIALMVLIVVLDKPFRKLLERLGLW